MQDTGSGLASVVATKATNAEMTIPSFAPGHKDPVVVRGTKINQSMSSVIELTVTDVAGNVTVCDPVMTVVIPDDGKPVEQTFGDIPRNEHWVRSYNGDPGIRHLDVAVNGRKFKEINLEPARSAWSTSRPPCASAATPSRSPRAAGAEGRRSSS